MVFYGWTLIYDEIYLIQDSHFGETGKCDSLHRINYWTYGGDSRRKIYWARFVEWIFLSISIACNNHWPPAGDEKLEQIRMVQDLYVVVVNLSHHQQFSFILRSWSSFWLNFPPNCILELTRVVTPPSHQRLFFFFCGQTEVLVPLLLVQLKWYLCWSNPIQ